MAFAFLAVLADAALAFVILSDIATGFIPVAFAPLILTICRAPKGPSMHF